MLDETIRSAAKLLEAPIQKDGASWFLDVWVFHDPHDDASEARRQIVQAFSGDGGEVLFLSSTIGPYEAGLDLAPLLREMVAAMHCSLYLSEPDADGVEHLRIGSAVEAGELEPERLSRRIREVGMFADRFEALVFGRDVDVR